MKKDFLYPFQMEAVERLSTGKILNGGTGSGKSRTSLYWYFKENGGSIENGEYTPMKDPKDLYILTTAMKRNSLEWERELLPYRLSTDPDLNYYDNKVTVDSWNNVKKYVGVTNAYFIFDENKIGGQGAWSKTFLKITRNNNEWVILSATPGDSWIEFAPVFIANGFYKNKSEFITEHVVYSPYVTKYPKIERYVNTGRLLRLKSQILIDMDFERQTVQHHEDVYCSYDILKYKDVIKRRWDPFENQPIQQISGLCYILRKIVNSDESRQVALLELLEKIPRAIIFYSFDYELEILLSLGYGDDVVVAQYNGHVHEQVPTSERWVYLVNYGSGAEGWNCTTTDTIIFFSQTYSYKTLKQSIGRIDRLNTKYRELWYYHLKSRSGIDLAISKALKTKKKFNETKWAGW